jgi:Fe2+ transport system protein FeoA
MQRLPPLPHTECVLRSLGDDPLLARRLAQMGIVPGVHITVRRVGPLGDPVELAVEKGQSVALRAREVARLECQVLAGPLLAFPDRTGAAFRVRALAGGEVFRSRMARLGLEPGRELRLRAARHGFDVVLLPANREVPLGRGEASRVIVEPLEAGADHA